MNRSTRTGRVFSPYVVDASLFTNAPHPEIIHTGVDLGPFLESALARADRCAAALNADEDLTVVVAPDLDTEPGEWEDEEDLDSRPPSPLSDLPATEPPTRAPSPAADGPSSVHQLSRSPSPASDAEADESTNTTSDSDDIPDPDMPLLVPRALGRTEGRLRITPAAAAKRAIADHRLQAGVRTSFEPANAYTSSAGAWWGDVGVDALIFGTRHIKWDSRSPKLILDVHGRIIAILLGRPEDPDWDSVVRDAAKAMHRAYRRGHASGAFRAKDSKHRRGKYTVLTSGVSFGGGQKRPGNLVNSPQRQKLINYLLRNKSLRRLAGVQSNGLARYAPKLWRYYVDTLRLLFQHHEGLQHNFSNSVFPTATFNLPPGAVTDEHIDFNNLIHGLCGITSGGNFNHKKGGQMYMKQLKLVIDFPSGSSMLIPSAFVDHGNTPIREGESRFSLTQYAAGGLFWWVKYGFRSAKSLLASAGGAALVASFDGVPGSRWEWAMNLFSKQDELEADRRTAFSLA
ncbi:hypothetical protein FB451DRAFT_1381385 [Mycena latifolia]|nr:hypothetical protein FB451DRAFT_1381385 [Mycena latifolia]